MRWIFISLAIMNGLLLTWLLVFHDPQISSEQALVESFPHKSNAQKLKLLSEITDDDAFFSTEEPEVEPLPTLENVPDEELGQEITVSSPSLSPQPHSVMDSNEQDTHSSDEITAQSEDDPEALCTLVGPFNKLLEAEYFAERVLALNVNALPKEIKMPAGPGYRVYLEPEASRREALRVLAELQSKGIDSYVIPKGELANGISLGMFSQKLLADSRLKEMDNLGLAPKMDVIERTYKEIWVVLYKKEAVKLNDTSWARLMEGYDDLERRQNFCLDVAS